MLCPVGMMTETKSLRYSSPEWYWGQMSKRGYRLISIGRVVGSVQ